MMGFIVSSAAVLLAAWFGYVAGRAGAWAKGHGHWNRAYMAGWDTAVRQQRAGLTLRTHAERVPVGTPRHPPVRLPCGCLDICTDQRPGHPSTDGRCYPQDCPGPSLPRSNLRVPMPPAAPPRRASGWPPLTPAQKASIDHVLRDQFGHRNGCDCEICRDERDGSANC